MNGHQKKARRAASAVRIRKPRRLPVIAVLAALVLAVPAAAAQASVTKGAITLAASSTTVGVGDPVDVTMRLNTAGQLTNVVEADVTYPSSVLSLVSVDSTGSAFPSQFEGGSTPGLVREVVTVTPGTPMISGSDLLVITMHFQAIAPGTADVFPAGDAEFIVHGESAPYRWPSAFHGTRITVGSPSAFSAGHVIPDLLGQGAAHVVSVSGQGFVAGSTVAVSGTGVRVSNVTTPSTSSVKARFLVSPTAAFGYRDVTVVSGGRTTTCVACLYVNDETRVDGVVTNTGARGTTSTFHVTGIFVAGPDYKISAGPGVTFTNVHIAPDDVNNELYATMKVSSSAPTGLRTVTVTSLDDYGVQRCVKCLSIN